MWISASFKAGKKIDILSPDVQAIVSRRSHELYNVRFYVMMDLISITIPAERRRRMPRAQYLSIRQMS
jgi:hypothetical protein